MKRFKIFALVFSVLFTAITFAESQAANKEPNRPAYLKPIPPDKLKEDLDFLFKTIEDVHPNAYAHIAEATIKKEREQIEREIRTPLSRVDFYLKIAPLIAKLKDGHTRIDVPSKEYRQYIDSGGLLFPFDLDFDEGKAFITADYCRESVIPVSSEVLSINRIPVRTIHDRFVQLLSFESDSLKTRVVKAGFRRLLWLVYRFEGPYDLQYKPQSTDKGLTAKVAGVTQQTIKAKAGIAPKKDKGPKWTYRCLPAEKTAVVYLRTFTNLGQFKKFLKETFTEIQKDKIQSLIIDIRENGGGDSALGDALLSFLTDKPFTQFSRIDMKVSKQIKNFYVDMAIKRGVLPPGTKELPLEQIDEKTRRMWSTPEGDIFVSDGIPKARGENPLRFNGKVYVLIGDATFSSGSGFAAMVKDYRLGVLVGQETGGLATCYGDSYPFTLPNSKIPAYVSHKRFVRPSGQDDGRGVLPDYEVKQKPQDTAKGIDTVLQFTLNLIKTASEL